MPAAVSFGMAGCIGGKIHDSIDAVCSDTSIQRKMADIAHVGQWGRALDKHKF
jgi:hypothetical protein